MRRFLLPLIALLAGCSPLKTFNAVIPKDAGARLVAEDQAFAQHARGTLDLYAPRQAGAGPLPVIVFFYGGSWTGGAKEGYGFVGQAPDKQATQPINFASADDPPALLLVAGRDTLVFGHNGVRLAAALRQAGVPAEVTTYQGVGHVGILTAIAKPFRGKAPVLRDLVRFARQATATSGGTAQPAARSR